MTKGLTLKQFRMHVIGMKLRGNSIKLHGFARSDGPRDAYENDQMQLLQCKILVRNNCKRITNENGKS
jgi:hypothetical protein